MQLFCRFIVALIVYILYMKNIFLSHITKITIPISINFDIICEIIPVFLKEFEARYRYLYIFFIRILASLSGIRRNWVKRVVVYIFFHIGRTLRDRHNNRRSSHSL